MFVLHGKLVSEGKEMNETVQTRDKLLSRERRVAKL